jgi:hypothetical protein
MTAALLVLAIATIVPRESAASRCLTCHAMTNLAVRESATAALHTFSVSQEKFSASVHGRLTCEQCHRDTGSYPHQFPDGRANVTCAQECHAQDRDGRPYSHAATVGDFETSAHRFKATAAAGDRPTCLTCHGSGDPHAIESAKDRSPRVRMAMCVGCHDDRARMTRNHVEPDAVSSYRRSFHYKAITFGAPQAAVCEDCHTSHRILPPSDPRSSVAASALSATCGQTACHRGAGARFAVSGANHLDLRIRREPILQAEEWLFRILTAGTMAMLVIGIVLDVQKTFGWLAIARRVVRQASRQLDGAAAAARRTVRVARWLLVE